MEDKLLMARKSLVFVFSIHDLNGTVLNGASDGRQNCFLDNLIKRFIPVVSHRFFCHEKVVVKAEKVWERAAPSVTARYCVITSRELRSPPFAVWLVVVV